MIEHEDEAVQRERAEVASQKCPVCGTCGPTVRPYGVCSMTCWAVYSSRPDPVVLP